MKREEKIEKLNKIVAGQKSKWEERAEFRIKNEEWLNKSAEIALKILRTLRYFDMSQAKLAEGIGVSPQQISKIVKGKENLTLDTICKIEKVLNTELIMIPAHYFRMQLSEDFAKDHFAVVNYQKTTVAYKRNELITEVDNEMFITADSQQEEDSRQKEAA